MKRLPEEIKNNEPIPINQHYVPRFYMKNFSIIKKTRKEDKVFIGFYQFDGELLKENVPTKSICYENYFYGEDGKIENDFRIKETKWAEVIKNIIEADKYNLEKDQEKVIKQFAIFQYSRTLAIYNYSKDMMAEMLQKGIINRTPDIKEEIVKELVDEKIENEVCVSDIISVCDNIVQKIDDLDVSIIKFNTTKKLITSDMPIITMNPFCPSKVGFANMGIVILFPVSPEVMVAIYDGKIYREFKPYMTISNEEEVVNLNKYQVISAEERILSKDRDELILISSDERLILKRKEYRSKRKVNSSFDGHGTFVATKSRSLYYDFELSFCKLPKYLKKIPIECRESFQRQYSNKLRLNLLLRVYKIPELAKKNKDFSQLNTSKMKDGYSEMLKFMDGYWNTPSQDRIITAEFIKKLKTVPGTFFPID